MKMTICTRYFEIEALWMNAANLSQLVIARTASAAKQDEAI